MNINEVIDECDTKRLNKEGVGLSDALVQIVEFAYTEGVKHNIGAEANYIIKLYKERQQNG